MNCAVRDDRPREARAIGYSYRAIDEPIDVGRARVVYQYDMRARVRGQRPTDSDDKDGIRNAMRIEGDGPGCRRSASGAIFARIERLSIRDSDADHRTTGHQTVGSLSGPQIA